MTKRIIDWLLRNATFRLYTDTIPAGRRLGGHDIPNTLDTFIILDIRIGDRIVLLGYFQTT
jgi:hypothetical protein